MKCPKTQLEYDFLVIGSGLSGLSFALKAAEFGRVALVSKSQIPEGNSLMAQGGIAASLNGEEEIRSHIEDTLRAGSGLCRPEVVEEAVRKSSQCIGDLQSWGVEFDRKGDGDFDLHKEGGHSHRRIFHIGDHTGSDIISTLIHRIKNVDNIDLFENHMAIDLILNKKVQPFFFGQDHCLGAFVFSRDKDEIVVFKARATVLATGGAGKVYLYTSNWKSATGDGIAIAHRAGARVGNLEFMQFHPTCLYHPQANNFLISEALRGEGAEIVNEHGVAFLRDLHPLGSLAPRDFVARSIDAEMKRTGADCVYLDITHHSKAFLKKHFPVIYQNCQNLGIHMETDRIPVVPAAHYLCGGVLSNLSGQTDLKGLFVLGETALTGIHGANRLASNSLLECIVQSSECIAYIKENWSELSTQLEVEVPSWSTKDRPNTDEMSVITHMWAEIRRLMWNYVGIVRTDRRLERAEQRLRNILVEIQRYYSNYRIHPDIVELRNIALVANLTVKCALQRKESRGIHFNLDHPESENADSKPRNSIV